MVKTKKSNYCKMLFLFMFIFLIILFFAFLILFKSSKYTENQDSVGMQLYDTSCVYSTDSFYYKGYCYIANELLDIRHEREKFNNYKKENIRSFQYNCKEFIGKNFYNSYVSEGDNHLSSKEEFLNDSFIKDLIDIACALN